MQIFNYLRISSWVFSAVCDTALPAEETSLPIPLTVLQPVKTKSITSELENNFFHRCLQNF